MAEPALQSDDDVGIHPASLQSDDDVGIGAAPLQSDTDVGLAQKPGPRMPGFMQAQSNYELAIGDAFFKGVGEAWPERLGLSDESKKFFEGAKDKAALEGGIGGLIKFQEAAVSQFLADKIATTFDIATSIPSAVYSGLQGAGVAAGLPNDVVSIPDAFLGSPHPLGVPIPEAAVVKAGEVAEHPLAPHLKGVEERIAAQREEVDKLNGLAKEATDAGDIERASALTKEAEQGEAQIKGLDNAREAFEDVIKGRAVDLNEARDLGVIGPERPDITEGTPEEVAARTARGDAEPVAASPTGEDGAPAVNGWRQRFDHFVGKLETPEDVQKLIRNSADENNDFPEARQGNIPARDIEDVAAAAGVDPSEVNGKKLGRVLQNDQQTRVAMRLMLQATENVKATARDVVANPTEQNLIKFQEHILRRDMAVEEIVGLRAQWGRVGNVFQEFMRDVKEGQALDSFLKDKCPL